MNIVIFSGGTGSIALQNGLKQIMPSCFITNIINAYDDGKSTGICREICHILGPSDIRKNHETQYLNAHKTDANRNIIEFYTQRFDIPLDNEKEFCLDKLKQWSLSIFDEYVKTFFDLKLKSEYSNVELKDFSIANIVYSGAFKKLGYKDAIKIMCNYFSIPDNIILNITDDVLLKAKTNCGKILNREVDIVNFNEDRHIDYITEVFFTDRSNKIINPKPNIEDMSNAINNADLIIYSAGTQWASLIPTYVTDGLKEVLEKSKAKKICIMNLVNDKDMIGWSDTQVIDVVSKYIPINYVLTSNAQFFNEYKKDNCYNIKTIFSDMHSNVPSLHNPQKLAIEIFRIYFNLVQEEPNMLFFDFDDTIWSRDIDNNILSRDNVRKLNELAKYIKICIISGNSYKSLREKISTVVGSDMNTNFDIWADNAAIQYKNNYPVIEVEKCKLSKKTIDIITNIIQPLADDWLFNIEYRGSKNCITTISIKPIQDNKVRHLISKYLELAVQKNGLNDIIIKTTGRTTIDIYNNNCCKLIPYYIYNDKYDNNTFYIGDECDSGNDFEIANKCKNYYQVNNIEETNALITIIAKLFNYDIS